MSDSVATGTTSPATANSNAKSVIEDAMQLSRDIDSAGTNNYNILMDSLLAFAEKKLERQQALLATLRSLNM